jgi:hypothetical protein
LMLGDRAQIVGNHAPADPAFHPIPPVIETALQPMAASLPADPPFDARQLRPRRNHLWRSCACRAALLWPGRGSTTCHTPRCSSVCLFVGAASLPCTASRSGGCPMRAHPNPAPPSVSNHLYAAPRYVTLTNQNRVPARCGSPDGSGRGAIGRGHGAPLQSPPRDHCHLADALRRAQRGVACVLLPAAAPPAHPVGRTPDAPA